MITVTRSFGFDAAHALLNHNGKCKYLHGHHYVAEVTVTAPGLDEQGMVLDFAVIKEKIGDFIDEYWDHNILLHADHPLYQLWKNPVSLTRKAREEIFNNKSPWASGYNPTAENLAEILFRNAIGLLPEPFKVIRVRMHETPNCYADYIEPLLSDV